MALISPEAQLEIERRIQLHFVDHTGDVITPAEWLACLTQIVLDMNAQEINAPELSADLARLQLQSLNDVEAAKKQTRTDLSASLQESFLSIAANENDPDAVAMGRAATIIERLLQ